jgi:hypothetical protein
MPSSIIGMVAGPIIGSLLGGGGGGGGGGSGASAAQDQAALMSAEATRQNTAIGQDQWDYYKKNYQPIEGNLIDQAMQAGSPLEFAKARGRANADVAGAFDSAQKQTQSRLQSYGINPASPAYQSAVGSVDLAQGAARVGALTAADNNTQQLAYSRALDIAGLGRNIPAQSAASAANAANSANSAGVVANASNQLAFGQNQTNMKNSGYAMAPITKAVSGAVSDWFKPSTGGYNHASDSSYGAGYDYGGYDYGADIYADGGKVSRFQKGGLVSRYADGGNIFHNLGIFGLADTEQTAPTNINNPNNATKPAQFANGQPFESLMPTTPWSISNGQNGGSRPSAPAPTAPTRDQLRSQLVGQYTTTQQTGGGGAGFNLDDWYQHPEIYQPQSTSVVDEAGLSAAIEKAMSGYKDGGTITPHMRRGYADGGEIEPAGLEPNDASNMGKLAGPGTETSDSIPAVIDGQAPAALSTGEVVMNADAVKLTGEEIMEAINNAGLQRRQHGLEPANEEEAQPQAFRKVGKVLKYAKGGAVCYAKHGLGG